MQSYEEELSAVLAMMAATLKGASQDKASLAQAWVMVVRPRVDQRWLGPACEHFLLNSTWFPTPAEFIERATDLRDRSEIQARLDATRDELKALDMEGREDRRRRNLEAGIDPDAPLALEVAERLMDGLVPALGPRIQEAPQGS